MKEDTDYNESHSPIPEEDGNVEYIIVDPRSLSDDESGSSKKRSRWEYWETKTLIDIMKQQDIPRGDRRSMKNKENFFLLEQEMRKRGVERWNSGQIQQKWRNLRKDWFNSRITNYRNGTAKTTSEFQEELDELFGTPPSNCSLSGVDTTSGDEIMGYEVETLEPTDHLSVVIDNDDKMSRGSSRCSSSPRGKKHSAQQTMHEAKPSSSSEDVQEVDSAHESVEEKKLKKKVQSTPSRKDLFIWPHRGVLLLIKQYKKVEHEFFMGKRRHNKIWDDIATAICSINPDLKVTGLQCQQKISGLKRTYSSIKENRSYARNEKITWPYFQIVDKIFGDKDPPQSILGPKIRKRELVIPRKTKHASTTSSSDEEMSAAPHSSKGKGSYRTALAAFATDIAERQEKLVRTMMEEARRTSAQEAKRQQEYERKLMIEHTTLLTSQLRDIISENTRATLQGIQLLMDLSRQMVGASNVSVASTSSAGESEIGAAPPGNPTVTQEAAQVCPRQETAAVTSAVPAPKSASSTSSLLNGPCSSAKTSKFAMDSVYKRIYWTERETKLLLTTMKEHNILSILDKKKYRKSEVFDVARKALAEDGYVRTNDQILTKWGSLKKLFDDAKKNTNKSGSARIEVEHMELLQDILGDRLCATTYEDGVDTASWPRTATSENHMPLVVDCDPDSFVAEETANSAGSPVVSFSSCSSSSRESFANVDCDAPKVSKKGRTLTVQSLYTNFSKELRETQKSLNRSRASGRQSSGLNENSKGSSASKTMQLCWPNHNRLLMF